MSAATPRRTRRKPPGSGSAALPRTGSPNAPQAILERPAGGSGGGHVPPLREPKPFSPSKAQWEYMMDRIQRLERLFAPGAPPPPKVDALPPAAIAQCMAIAAEVARVFRVGEEFIFSRSKLARHADPRHVAMYVCYWRVKDAGQDALAQLFRKKCASTVSASLRAVQDRADTDKAFSAQVQSLMDWAAAWKPESEPHKEPEP